MRPHAISMENKSGKEGVYVGVPPLPWESSQNLLAQRDIRTRKTLRCCTRARQKRRAQRQGTSAGLGYERARARTLHSSAQIGTPK